MVARPLPSSSPAAPALSSNPTRPAILTAEGPMGVRIGNGCGFWGDSVDAPARLAERGGLHYLTLEYLAELTMSILALQKQRDPGAGYASDFPTVLSDIAATLNQKPGGMGRLDRKS